MNPLAWPATSGAERCTKERSAGLLARSARAGDQPVVVLLDQGPVERRRPAALEQGELGLAGVERRGPPGRVGHVEDRVDRATCVRADRDLAGVGVEVDPVTARDPRRDDR